MYDNRSTIDEVASYVAPILAEYGYRVGGNLGRGTYAIVLKCVKVSTGQRLAVKIVDSTNASREFIDKFFPRELDLIRRLDHPNIIRVERVLRVGVRSTCIVMERADGGDLLEHLMKHRMLREPQARHLFAQVLSALAYLHRHGIAHRDIKCENILLIQGDDDDDQPPIVRLTDFGFARFVYDPETQRRLLSQTYCGSAAYAAPEIIRGEPYNALLADSWSLGVILYILVTGKMPFDDSNLGRMLRYQQEGRWSIPRPVRRSLSNNCKHIIGEMLEPDVTERVPITRLRHHVWLHQRADVVE